MFLRLIVDESVKLRCPTCSSVGQCLRRHSRDNRTYPSWLEIPSEAITAQDVMDVIKSELAIQDEFDVFLGNFHVRPNTSANIFQFHGGLVRICGKSSCGARKTDEVAVVGEVAVPMEVESESMAINSAQVPSENSSGNGSRAILISGGVGTGIEADASSGSERKRKTGPGSAAAEGSPLSSSQQKKLKPNEASVSKLGQEEEKVNEEDEWAPIVAWNKLSIPQGSVIEFNHAFGKKGPSKIIVLRVDSLDEKGVKGQILRFLSDEVTAVPKYYFFKNMESPRILIRKGKSSNP